LNESSRYLIQNCISDQQFTPDDSHRRTIGDTVMDHDPQDALEQSDMALVLEAADLFSVEPSC
jgi:hypothetical protein